MSELTKPGFFAVLSGLIGGGLGAWISGSVGSGNVLTANLAARLGAASAWQWKRDGTNIAGATSSTYTQVTADLGTTVSVLINGTYAASVSVPGIAPTVTSAPSVASATTSAGLTWTPGVYTGTPTATVTASVFVNGALVASNVTQGSYTPTLLGGSLVVKETATNVAGGVQSSSSVVTITNAVLMSVAMENYNNTADAAMTGFDSCLVYRPFTIASGDVNGFRLAFDARRLSPGGSASVATASYTVTNCYANSSNFATQSPLITFGGGPSLTVASGAVDQQSDVVLPSALGLSVFAVGSVVWIKCILSFAAGANLGSSSGLNGNWAGTSQTNVEFFAYNSANTTPTNITTPGKFTWTGTTPTPQSSGFAFKMLGTFTSGTPPVWFGAGDSIPFGYADLGTAGTNQRGIFNRALWSDGVAANKRAGINACISGLVGTAYTQDSFGLYYAKYCNRAMVEVGTNDFTFTGGTAVSTVQATRTAIYGALRSANASIKILDTLLGPRTTCAVSVSSISGDGSTATLTTTSAFVASIGGVGSTRTCVVSGATPSGYNTVAAGVTMTVASSTTVTYANTTTGASSGAITISDLWATETNQTWAAPVSGTGWAPGGNISTFNAWVKSNGNEAYVDFPQWHGSGSPQNWSGPGSTVDGLHPNGPTINAAMAATLRTAMDALA